MKVLQKLAINGGDGAEDSLHKGTVYMAHPSRNQATCSHMVYKTLGNLTPVYPADSIFSISLIL